jgi:Protein of unknown function (DUF2442)
MNEKAHEVGTIRIDEDYLYLTVDGKSYRVHWEDCSPKLAKASLFEKSDFEISPAGYGIHWPLVDEDLAITPLLHLEGTELEKEVA